MEISASLVMQLREKTGVSMMACKKALVEANGDMDKAIEILRKSGEAKAASKADRTTKEGGVFIQTAGNKMAIVSVLCETDFVARSDDFIALGKQIAALALEKGEGVKEEAEQLVKAAIAKLGENMSIGTLRVLEGQTWGSYIHSNNKVAAVVAVADGTEEQARDVAMHVTATNPKYLSPEDVDAEFIAKEKEIMVGQLKNEGKPENMWERILEGKVKKLREENALLTQAFVKDPSLTIQKFLGNTKVTAFERVAV